LVHISTKISTAESDIRETLRSDKPNIVKYFSCLFSFCEICKALQIEAFSKMLNQTLNANKDDINWLDEVQVLELMLPSTITFPTWCNLTAQILNSSIWSQEPPSVRVYLEGICSLLRCIKDIKNLVSGRSSTAASDEMNDPITARALQAITSMIRGYLASLEKIAANANTEEGRNATEMLRMLLPLGLKTYVEVKGLLVDQKDRDVANKTAEWVNNLDVEKIINTLQAFIKTPSKQTQSMSAMPLTAPALATIWHERQQSEFAPARLQPQPQPRQPAPQPQQQSNDPQPQLQSQPQNH
jgi:hypothetical protein